jgi:hypothetical protein
MNNDKIERAIGDGWYFFIDIIGVSNPNLSITCQLEKIIKLIDIIESFLNVRNNPEIYKSFTGLTVQEFDDIYNIELTK